MDILEDLKEKNIILKNGINPKYKIIINKNASLKNKLFETTKFVRDLSDNSIKERIYCIINDISEPVLCKNCKIIPVKFSTSPKHKNSYGEFCSVQCSNGYWRTKQKRIETNLKKFGVENPSSLEDIKQKRIITSRKRFGCDYPWQTQEVKNRKKEVMLEEYGVENVFQISSIRDKQKETNLNKYGVEYASQCPAFLDKMKRTNIRKYGVENPQQNEEVQLRTRQTNLEKYGVETPLQNRQIIEKIKTSIQQKYGVENISQSELIKEKKKTTSLEHYGVENPSQSEIVKKKIKQTNNELYGGFYPQQQHNLNAFEKLLDYDWLYNEYVNKLKTSKQIGEDLGVAFSTVCLYIHRHNILIRRIGLFSIKCLEWLEYTANKENIFIQHCGNVGEYRIPDTKFYADGYCEETNTIYEFYGDLWHGNPQVFEDNENCHPFDPFVTAGELYEKTMERERIIRLNGYNLVTVWENEWDSL